MVAGAGKRALAPVNRASMETDDMTYLLDNAAPQAPDRFRALAELYDAGTIGHLERCGIADGWRCLEVGGGGGSIARWLAPRI